MLAAPLGGRTFSPRPPAHAPQRHGGGILAVIGGHVLDLTSRNPGDKDSVTVYVRVALFAFWAMWHIDTTN
jgi:hypothetical protein